MDPTLRSYVEALTEDPDTVGVLLHGSRASGRHRADSDYDLIRIVTPAACSTSGATTSSH
jgi:predicted nucleotidyltransferase